MRQGLWFDARMLGRSGIGTQVRNVLRLLADAPELELTLLGDPAVVRTHLPDFAGRVIAWTAPIYSSREQWSFPKPSGGALLHVPHYNAPLRSLERSIVVVHDLIHLQSEEFARAKYRVYARFMLAQIARRARGIVTVSETTRRELIARFPRAAERTVVIHNGVDHELYRPPPATAVAAFRARHRLPEEFLLTVGIGKRHKHVDFVVRALGAGWRDGSLAVPLVLGGVDGRVPDYVAREIEHQRACGQVLTLPFLALEEMPLLYAAARVFVMPSLLEGFGLPMVEAMACGTPVLAADASCLPEIAAAGALYFDPTDAGDFRRKLETALGDEERREALRSLALERAAGFRWERHARELVALYRTCS